ncbi:MAG: hypothetical protein WBW73_01690 [Rhodoplanes sp.]
MKKMIFAGVAIATGAFVTPAFSDFYIVQDASTKECRIVEERPAPSVGVVIGSPFGVRVEAENHMHEVEVCREGAPADEKVIIDRRD